MSRRNQLSVKEVLDTVPSCVWEFWFAQVAGRGDGCRSRTGRGEGGGGGRHLCWLGSSHISCVDPGEQEAEGRRPGALDEALQ